MGFGQVLAARDHSRLDALAPCRRNTFAAKYRDGHCSFYAMSDTATAFWNVLTKCIDAIRLDLERHILDPRGVFADGARRPEGGAGASGGEALQPCCATSTYRPLLL
jgi:hypothetical protein